MKVLPRFSSTTEGDKDDRGQPRIWKNLEILAMFVNFVYYIIYLKLMELYFKGTVRLHLKYVALYLCPLPGY